MKLAPIARRDFSLWSKFRSEIYPLLDPDHDAKEIEQVFQNDLWHCWFVERKDGRRIGLVELSLRNIVDGCLSSPVPYLEGLYLIESERNKGAGEQVVEIIKRWCEENGYAELATDAEISNVRAQSFYERLGFEKVDKVVEYKLYLGKHRRPER